MKLPRRPMPISMRDQGFYDEHSQTQRAIINMTLPFVESALSAMTLPKDGQAFVIVDYGCSEGKNSVYVVNKVIEIVRQRQQRQLFSVIFNDLPQNNFNRLFENIYAQNERDDSVLAFASAQPFHSQVMPAQSVHFGYSSSAAHWLTELPLQTIHSHIYVADATENEKNKLGEIAARDWQNFLSSRAAEMIPGARLVITMASNLTGNTNSVIKIGDKPFFSSRTGPQETYTAQIILNLINDIVQELVKEKKISRQQVENICFPIYPRNLDEVIAPINESELKQKFILEQAHIVQLACPLFEQYLSTGDNKTYARLLTDVFKAFMETFLLHQLGASERRPSGRSGLAGQMLFDEIFNHMQSRIQAKPEYYTFFPIHSVIVLARK